MKTIQYDFDTIPSTNDWAKQNLSTFEQNCLTVLAAKSQSAGRGQYGRKWISSENNLYVSFCFFAHESKENFYSLTHLLGISVTTVLEKMGLKCQIKWPNDLLIEKKKVAGILCEVVPMIAQSGIVLGLGLNVNMKQEDLDQIDQPATSLYVETQKEHSIEEILDSLKKQFACDLESYKKLGFFPFAKKFQDLLISKF